LGRSIHFHLFRHSSATYYADKLNRQQLCIRYGWTFSSRMPDIYIARAGVDMQDLDERFTSTEIGTVKDSLAKMEHEAKIKDERIEQLEHVVTLLQKIPAIAEVMRMNPSINGVQFAIQRKRRTNNVL
jgi:hypothetical protein